MPTTVVITLDERRPKRDGSCPIILRINHERKTIALATGFTVAPTDWDEAKRRVKRGCKAFESVTRVNNDLEKRRSKAVDVITRLQDRGELTILSVAELKERIENKRSSRTFFTYTQQLVDELVKQGRIGTAGYYRNVLREIKAFRRNRDFPMKELTYTFLMQFEAFYLGKGLELNGLNAYLRGIKAIVNRAIKDRIIEREHYPFEQYVIRAKPTRKRAISFEAIMRLAALELEPNTVLYEAQQIFLLSFYTMGTPFMDLALLKLSNIVEGRIQYQRAKTGKHFDIKITEAAAPIIAYFSRGKEKGEYLLPFVKREMPTKQYMDVSDGRRRYNKRLKVLAEMAGIEENLTSYVSRHSFASQANNLAIPVTAISEMMGHQRLTTTQVYLAGLQKNVIDEYNERVLKGGI